MDLNSQNNINQASDFGLPTSDFGLRTSDLGLPDSTLTPRILGYQFPAEWEPHEATWLSWPHKEESWPGKLDEIYPRYCEFIKILSEDEFVMSIPTLSKGNLIAISSNKLLNLEEEIGLAEDISGEIKKELINDIFSEIYNNSNMFIDDTNIEDGYIRIVGNNYAKITSAPVIALEIEEKLKANMNVTKKRDYIDKKREVFVFKDMSKEQRNKLIELDKRYGNIICSCSNISEGEIVDSIRRPLGARTLEGVKRRTGIGRGSCNGSSCNMKIMKILAREMNKNILDIVDDSMESKILVGRIKEFNEI